MKTNHNFLNNQNKNAMKKVIVIFALMIIAFAGKVSAQAGRGKVSLQDFHFFKTTTLKEGNNTVPFEKQGTVRFLVRNGQILNVMHQDAAGKVIRVAETADPTEHNPTPNPGCNGNLRCVKNTETNTMVCFCTPDVISSGPSKDPIPATIVLSLIPFNLAAK